MPNAALIALTSPLLLAQAPEVALDPVFEPAPTIQYAYVVPMDMTVGAGVLNLNWTLANAQPVEGPPGERDPDDSQPEEGAEEDTAQTDDNQIVVEGSYGPPRNDPAAQINEESYRITQALDDAFVEPMAYAYRDGLPDPLRDGLGNFVKNLSEPNNALNFLLQGKFGKAFETLGRLAVNSTLGLGGLFDVAKRPGLSLPYRRNGWANTMGFYGIGGGPYLYLPITGATTARDVIGSGLDQLLLPTAVGKPFNRPEFTVPYFVVSNLDSRLEFDQELGRIEDTVDPYAARRDSYLYRRAKTIAELKGEEPPERPLIMDEVEGTGDFADPPEGEEVPMGEGSEEPLGEPKVAVIITKPR